MNTQTLPSQRRSETNRPTFGAIHELPATLEALITRGNDVLYGKGMTGLPDFDQLKPFSSLHLLTHTQAPGRVVTIA